MNVYTFYSETHKVFFPWFDTLKDVDPTAIVKYCEVPQVCPSGAFAQEGWNEAMAEKLKHVLSAYSDEGDSFIYSDLDVQFFSPVTTLAARALQNHDIVFQNDYYGDKCAGFFYCKKNEKTKRMFEHALEIISRFRDDQPAIQHVLRTTCTDVSTALLPPQFFTFGMFYDHWKGQEVFPLPPGIVVHHANWVEGIDNKLKLLQAVRNNFNNNNFLNDRF